MCDVLLVQQRELEMLTYANQEVFQFSPLSILSSTSHTILAGKITQQQSMQLNEIISLDA